MRGRTDADVSGISGGVIKWFVAALKIKTAAYCLNFGYENKSAQQRFFSFLPLGRCGRSF